MPSPDDDAKINEINEKLYKNSWNQSDAL